jgi:hypothetical protein
LWILDIVWTFWFGSSTWFWFLVGSSQVREPGGTLLPGRLLSGIHVPVKGLLNQVLDAERRAFLATPFFAACCILFSGYERLLLLAQRGRCATTVQRN